MSQNRTVIQGLEPDNGQGGNNMNSGLGNSFYSRSGRQAAKGTVVPGMMGNETRQPDNNSGEQPQQRHNVTGDGAIALIVDRIYRRRKTPDAEPAGRTDSGA